ncbi:hypothetical protein BDR06DRAFT_968588 [Suillus hirtellus]|nr:hypothetical protein BDR06DRAFT_968588 [Suillus hirtellus]
MTPTQSANNALNATLADVQLLMKCCMKFKEADPETFRLLDEIARQVAKDLKLYMGTATSFPPLLLSCAAIIWQYSKAGTFESVPNWTSTTEDDPRIKTHPRFKKTLGYCPPTPTPTPADIPANLDPQGATSASVTGVPSAMDPIVPPFAPLTLPVGQPLDNLVTALAAEPELVSLVQDSMAAGLQTPPHLPVKYDLFVAGTKKKTGHTAPQVGNSKKRKAGNEDLDAAVVTDGPKSPPPSSKPRQKRKKKFQSPDEDKVHTRTIFIKSKATSDNDSDAANDRTFLKVETRPAEWGLDSHIAMLLQHSIQYHPQPCDKCTKLDMPCLVLLDKKFRNTRLACANCDHMKVTCAIDGVSVRERMQAKAAAAKPNPSKLSRTRTPKSCAISKTLAKKMLPQPPHSSGAKPNIIEEAEEQPNDVLLVNVPIPAIRSSQRPAQDGQLAQANLADPKPTARDILQGIQDLGRRLDLLATNEQVDALEVRVHSLENILHQHLNMLEQHLNTSDAQ